MTSTSAISDALSQVQQIEAQLTQLSSGQLLDSALGVVSSSTGSSDSSTSATEFADALSTALNGGSSSSADTTGSTASNASDLLATSSSGSGSGTSTANMTLPSAASSLLTSDQQSFAKTLSAQTGLSPGVVCAWLLAEESGGAATARQAQGNNDWLNIGYTDSATYGSSDSIWSNPTSAADATAAWLKGKDSIPGYGTASSGVQSILDAVGQSTGAQISALQNSGWASSGYRDLGELYDEVTGG